MPAYYFDTSALVKRYHLERGSEKVDALFADPASALFTANITLPELTSALDRKVQDGTFAADVLPRVLSAVARDLIEEFWLIELDRIHVRRSQDLILRHHLRTLDALHLAVLTTLREMAPILVCSDQRLLVAAQAEGYSVLDPAE